MSLPIQQSGSVIATTNLKESEKQYITVPKQPNNTWLVVKFKYQEYVLPAEYAHIMLDMITWLEPFNDAYGETSKITAFDSEHNITIRYMSDTEYKNAKANTVLQPDA